MPPPRLLDPLGLPDKPNYVTDPAREAELVAELKRKIDYLCASYHDEMRLGLGQANYNASVVRLKQAVAQVPFDRAELDDLYPWIRWTIDQRARELSEVLDDAPFSEVDDRFVVNAAIELAGVAKCVRGKTGRDVLRRYVEALMALLQEAYGEAIIGSRVLSDQMHGPLSGWN